MEPPSPHYLARVGARPNPNKGTKVSLLQAVRIPLNVTSIVISGVIRIDTEENVSDPDPDIGFDRLDLALQEPDPASDFFRTLGLWYYTDATKGWLEFEKEYDDAGFWKRCAAARSISTSKASSEFRKRRRSGSIRSSWSPTAR